MTIVEIKNQIEKYKRSKKKIFVTSSFQTQSIAMLHILSSIVEDINVIFLHTGFHFPETISFRDKVVELLGLHLVDVKSLVPKIQKKRQKWAILFCV